jgi:hypothetical protein
MCALRRILSIKKFKKMNVWNIAGRTQALQSKEVTQIRFALFVGSEL